MFEQLMSFGNLVPPLSIGVDAIFFFLQLVIGLTFVVIALFVLLLCVIF